MIFLRIFLKNFKMIEGPLEIVFPESGKIGVLGLNEAGKSTLFEAIKVALFGVKGNDSGRKDLVTWGKKSAEVELDFKSGDAIYRVVRKFGVSGKHEVQFYGLVKNGWEVLSSNVSDTEELISGETGLERDTFSKLVYIGQKDLDALKDLGKSNREAMVNKVMGMEVFDDVEKDVKADLKELENHFSILSERFESLKRAKGEVDVKSLELSKSESKLKSLSERRGALESVVSEKNRVFEAFEWLKEYNSVGEALGKVNETLHQLGERLKNKEKLESEVSRVQESLRSKEETFTRFEKVQGEIQAVAQEFRKIEEKIEELEGDVSGLSRQLSQLPVKHVEKSMVSPLPYIIGLVLGLVLFLVGLLGSLYSSLFFLLVSLLGFVVAGAALAVFIYRRYGQPSPKVDVKLESINDQIKQTNTKLTTLRQQHNQLASKTGVNSSKESEKKAYDIQVAIKSATGCESVEDLRSSIKHDKILLESRKAELKGLSSAKLESSIESKSIEVAESRKKLEELNTTRPASVEGLVYSEREYSKAKKAHTEVVDELNGLLQDLKKYEGLIEAYQQDLKRLREQLADYPKVEAEVSELTELIRVKERVVLEIKETGKELRSRVLPFAAYKINQILPQITDGRYDRLEISEDLKFSVYSLDAGEAKPREVFSGGTQDQFLIALRLAFTESILDSRVKADKYALLMDECIASSDEVRKDGIFEALNAMKNTFSQILIISHEDISNQVDYTLSLERAEDGHTKIRQYNGPRVSTP